MRACQAAITALLFGLSPRTTENAVLPCPGWRRPFVPDEAKPLPHATYYTSYGLTFSVYVVYFMATFGPARETLSWAFLPDPKALFDKKMENCRNEASRAVARTWRPGTGRRPGLDLWACSVRAILRNEANSGASESVFGVRGELQNEANSEPAAAGRTPAPRLSRGETTKRSQFRVRRRQPGHRFHVLAHAKLQKEANFGSGGASRDTGSTPWPTRNYKTKPISGPEAPAGTQAPRSGPREITKRSQFRAWIKRPDAALTLSLTELQNEANPGRAAADGMPATL